MPLVPFLLIILILFIFQVLRTDYTPMLKSLMEHKMTIFLFIFLLIIYMPLDMQLLQGQTKGLVLGRLKN